MNLFDILGPVMVGPSSSHTAGAVKIGLVARRLLGDAPVQAHILLHGSFASTGNGHGTDRALVAGLLGMEPDDLRIPKSLELAEDVGMHVRFGSVHLRGAHPNTASLSLKSKNGRELQMVASSLGGGRIQVCQIRCDHKFFRRIQYPGRPQSGPAGVCGAGRYRFGSAQRQYCDDAGLS